MNVSLLGSEGGWQDFTLRGGEWAVLIASVAAALLALAVGFYLARSVMAEDEGTPRMKEIAAAIQEGALAYLKRQFKTIAVILVPLAAVVFLTSTEILNSNGDVALSFGLSGLWRTVAFVLGCFASGLTGYIGMTLATRGNVRTAAAALTGSMPRALTVAFRTGGVAGMFTVGLGLLGATVIIILFQNTSSAILVGFGFGGSLLALFLRVGGGIFTKAADVGADLVGKVEAGIPEDDPRNPAVIADLVGDNVGDCAGRGADLFESSAAEMIGAMILGAALFQASGGDTSGKEVGFLFFPLVVAAFGLVASLVGTLAVRPPANPREPMSELNKGFFVTAALSAVLMVVACFWMLPHGNWQYALCGLIGIATSFAFVYITEYYTSDRYRPVQSIAQASQTGPATNIISGIAVGFETTGLSALTVAAALLSSYYIGDAVDFPESSGVARSAGIFGTAVATMGMLMSAAYILAMDTFGPITDNAGGVVEMSNQPDSVRAVTDALDSAGNTTKALTKGYAVGTAALAAFLLFSAFLQEVQRFGGADVNASVVNLADPRVFVGGLIGAMLIFVFASLAMRAVGRAAQSMIAEVRRQFAEDPGILAGTSLPNYARCVDISVRAALREMVAPGILAVAVPILVGVILRWEAAAGMLMIGTITGVLVANVLNNGGGAWDNAKKMIEAGHLKDTSGMILGKGTQAHEAAVVGDTVGDPWKDTAGPSLHVLIKLLATITLVLAPLFI